MSRQINRREFLKQTTTAGIGFWVVRRSTWAKTRSPNGKSLDHGEM